MQLHSTPWAATAAFLLLGFAAAIVDEAGRYRPGGDLGGLAPPEPTEEDRNASVDLSKQPAEKLFRLLAFELLREEKRAPEQELSVGEFQTLSDLSCQERLLHLVQEANRVVDEVRTFHINITGTSGLFWLLHKYPEEHSWVWLIAVSHERTKRKVGNYVARLSSLSLDRSDGCMSPNFRTVLMNALATWKKIQGDHVALLWNGVAFGVLGDVTAWRELDEDGVTAEEGPGGPPPNVSWSENLIFANMWLSSVQKWLEYHVKELMQAAYTEVARAQAGLQPQEQGKHWLEGAGGALSTFEYLRRQVWGGWELDKGFLRGFLRHCLQPGYGDSARVSVVDFGAGGGQYCEWLNDTGLVDAVALDATREVHDMTGGAVMQLDLASEVELWRGFEWVLCLGVGGQLQAEGAETLLRNVRRHAQRGLVLSWASAPRSKGAQEDALGEPELVAMVERATGLGLDRATTEAVRQECEHASLAENVLVFRRSAL